MHIPDGYLSPQTYIPAYAAAVPFWAYASRQLNKTLRTRQVPLLALGAAFSFVIMMFNVPIPGGTTGHAVGSVLIAILLGPWAAVVAVSLALVVQAFIFGDGGITAIGANCLNMAVIMPFVGWWVYRAIAGSATAASARQWIGAAIGAYIGLNIAAATTAVMFGIQPYIATDSAGRALYQPFGLGIALPAMAIEHLLIFGFVEAIVTGFVIAYFQKVEPSLLARQIQTGNGRRMTPIYAKLGIAVGILAILTPLGIYLPQAFNAGDAWGEWAPEDIPKVMVEETGRAEGYVPVELERQSGIWKAPLPDYAFPEQQEESLGLMSMAYILSALVGIVLLTFSIMSLKKFISSGKNSHDYTSGMDALSGGA